MLTDMKVKRRGLGRVKGLSPTSTAVKRPRRFLFYLVGFYLILSGNMGKDV